MRILDDKWRLLLGILLGGLIISVLSVWLADTLFPPDLSKASDLSVVVHDKNGQALHLFLSKDEQWRLPIEHLPPDYKRLLIAYEDQRFYHHSGVDFLAIVRALRQNSQSGRIVSGASTITMQSARLLMPHPRSYRHKILEMWRAWQLEQRYSKDQLLNLYATLAPMGGNIQGISAASQLYFQQAPDKLSLAQYALLVALPQSPQRVLKQPVSARNRVLEQAYLRQAISQHEYQQAINEPLALQRHPVPRLAPHHARQLKRQHPDKQAIQSTLEHRWQSETESLLQQALSHFDQQSNLAALILDNHSNDYRVYIGSAQQSTPRLGYIDLLQAVRSPGSTLKPFITLLAFDRLNYQAHTLISDTPLSGTYRPQNYDGRYLGQLTLAQALIRSRNIPAVALLEKIGADQFSAIMADQAALPFYLPKNSHPNLSIALGGVGTRATDLAQAYRRLALCSRGLHPLAKANACATVSQILQQNQDQQGRFTLGASPIAVKTGTSYGWRDLWVIAYNDDYTWLIWAGRADGGFSVQRPSAEILLPLLRRVIALTPNPPKHYTPLITTRAKPLSPYLQRIDNDNHLAILQPLDQAHIQYHHGMHLALIAKGGQAPYLWIINGKHLNSGQTRTNYPLPSSGTYHIELIDENGNSAHATIRAQTPPSTNHAKLRPID